jgi:hypothetical protein
MVTHMIQDTCGLVKVFSNMLIIMFFIVFRALLDRLEHVEAEDQEDLR